MHSSTIQVLLSLAALAAPALVHGAAQVTSVAGADAAAITAAVTTFRTTIGLGGVNNAVLAGPFATGFRNINWDAVPDTVASPNLLPGTFFNANSQRGALLSTPGTGLLVSADDSNPTTTPVRFGEINAAYAAQFQTFSTQRLFAAQGSTIINCDFFVPGSPATPGTVSSFGVVFCDVDEANRSLLEFFNVDGVSLGTWRPAVANNGLSFLGVFFDAGERAARVRITHGNLALGATNNDATGQDVVVVDDFMYGEPLPYESQSKLVNVSTRGFVGSGDAILIGGFVIRGTEPKTILVRGVGPGIAPFLSGTLINPTLDIVNNSTGAVIATNDNWNNNLLVEHVSAAVGAFALTAGSNDAATVVVLNPGSYTVRVSGTGGATGIALVEAYEY